MFQYFHVEKKHQAKVKQKDWMRQVDTKGNYTFHTDYDKKAVLTLVYGSKENLNGGHFEIYDTTKQIVYRIPSFAGRFSLISILDGKEFYHRGTMRIPIQRKAEPSRVSRHTLLAFRGSQEYRNHNKAFFSYGS